MVQIKRFEDIEAWRAARELTQGIYRTTGGQSFSKDFGLWGQIQRASVSIMVNIAEGFDSQTNQAFIQFLGYALRSATEVQSHLHVALDQKYIAKVKSIIHGFIRYLRDVRKKNVERST